MKLISKLHRRSDWYVTSPYGMRKDPISGAQAMHYGTDYGTNGSKWALYALEEGVVHVAVKSTAKTGYGNYLWVRYPRINLSVRTAHMDSIAVKQGDKVKEGTLLGYTGTTGKSTGVHDHIEITKINSSVTMDPHAYEYIEASPDSPAVPPNTPALGTIERVYRNIKGRKESVEEWQRVLKKHGYDIGTAGPNKDGVDGDFGTKTDTATKAYQRSKGLLVDGDVGTKTWLSAGRTIGEAITADKPQEAATLQAEKKLLYGIDVSGHQRETVNDDVMDYSFVLVKATEGTTFLSDTYPKHMVRAMKRDKLMGVYHFAKRGDAKAEAAWFAKHFMAYKGQAIPALDYEAEATQNGREWVRSFMLEFKRLTGVMPWLYTYYSVAQSQNLHGLCKELGAGYWMAQYWQTGKEEYGKNPGDWIDGFNPPEKGPAATCDCWQYTSFGYVKNYGDFKTLRDRLDCNVFYGSEADWKSYY